MPPQKRVEFTSTASAKRFTKTLVKLQGNIQISGKQSCPMSLYRPSRAELNTFAKILFKNGIRTCKDDQAFLLFLNLPTPFLSYKGKASTESTYNTQREERLNGRKTIPATTTPKSKVIFTFLVDKLNPDGWPSWQRACLLRQLSGFESGYLSNIQNGQHKQTSGQHILARQKNIQKISNPRTFGRPPCRTSSRLLLDFPS